MTLESDWFQPLNLKCDLLVSNPWTLNVISSFPEFAFILNVYRYCLNPKP
jgi:hypothetical protein